MNILKDLQDVWRTFDWSYFLFGSKISRDNKSFVQISSTHNSGYSAITLHSFYHLGLIWKSQGVGVPLQKTCSSLDGDAPVPRGGKTGFLAGFQCIRQMLCACRYSLSVCWCGCQRGSAASKKNTATLQKFLLKFSEVKRSTDINSQTFLNIWNSYLLKWSREGITVIGFRYGFHFKLFYYWLLQQFYYI